MIKISAKAEYAARAVNYLSKKHQSGVPIQLDEISQRNTIPRDFLIQVMSQLAKSGYVASRRGIGGGYVLNKEPDQITLRSIIELIDGKIDEFRCEDPSFQNCMNVPGCCFGAVWKDLTTTLSTKLDSYNFGDLSA